MPPKYIGRVVFNDESFSVVSVSNLSGAIASVGNLTVIVERRQNCPTDREILRLARDTVRLAKRST
jgi:hypothetical protein